MKHSTIVKFVIALAVILVTLIILAFGLHIAQRGETQNTEPSGTTDTQTAPAPEISTSASTTTPESTDSVATTEATETTTIPTDTVPETTAPPATTVPPETTKPTDPPVVQDPEMNTLTFPYAIPGTDLVISQVNSYDGIFLEDGSDQTVTGISVIVLENQGKTGVEYANITLTQNGKQLQYKATALPAGAKIVVQEASAAAYSDDVYTACTADVAQMEIFEMSSSLVKVVENEDGSLSVTNLGTETIPCVRIFYKFAMEKGEIYVGGITYTAKIIQLESGATQQVYLSHYAAGSSEIMMIRTYATVD